MGVPLLGREREREREGGGGGGGEKKHYMMTPVVFVP